MKWALVAKIDTAEAFAPIYQMRQDLLIVGGLALLVVVATAAWLSRALLGPLRELTAGVKRFAPNSFGTRAQLRHWHKRCSVRSKALHHQGSRSGAERSGEHLTNG